MNYVIDRLFGVGLLALFHVLFIGKDYKFSGPASEVIRYTVADIKQWLLKDRKKD